MEKRHPYCDFILGLPKNDKNIHINYHNKEYGFPIKDDNELFGRLLLEINQAGLSWTTILNKEQNFREAFHNFNIAKVAAYKSKDVQRLLNNAGIIRNRLKVNAAIENAKRIIAIQKEHGSFKQWLDKQHPLSKEDWTKLFKKTFLFTGGEIVGEFLMSTGYLPGAHGEYCPVYKAILKAKPAWNRAVK